jgi:heat shock protein HtpX
LFLLVNILIVTTVTLVLNIVLPLFGVQLSGWGYIIPLYSMIGFGGAIFSLMTSKWMAKRMMGVQIIDPKTNNSEERRILEMVYGCAQRAKLPAMPEVGIFQSPEVNAFATGPSKSNSLVALSTGLLERMDNDGVEGVIGHEVAHIANGDMVTMTLLQGLINTMVLIVAHILANIVTSAMAKDEERPSYFMQHMIFSLFQFVFSLLGFMIVAAFSRRREFRADAGGARVAGRDRMLNGLRSLQGVYGKVDDSHPELATLKISGHPGGFMALFSTHPPLEERIRRLETMPL